MPEVTLEVKKRDLLGSSHSRRLRNQGLIPAVLYGSQTKPLPVVVEAKKLKEVFSSENRSNVLIRLEIEGKSQLVLAREIQHHPIKRRVQHVDFLVIDPEKKISTVVPLELSGTAHEVHRHGGRVEQIIFNVPIQVLPKDIPSSLEADITNLKVGEALRVRDIKCPEGVEIELDPDLLILTGQASRLSREHSQVQQATESNETIEESD